LIRLLISPPDISLGAIGILQLNSEDA